MAYIDRSKNEQASYLQHYPICSRWRPSQTRSRKSCWLFPEDERRRRRHCRVTVCMLMHLLLYGVSMYYLQNRLERVAKQVTDNYNFLDSCYYQVFPKSVLSTFSKTVSFDYSLNVLQAIWRVSACLTLWLGQKDSPKTFRMSKKTTRQFFPR